MIDSAAHALTSIALPDPVFGERQSYRVRDGVLEWGDATNGRDDDWDPMPTDLVFPLIMERPSLARVLADVIDNWHAVSIRAELDREDADAASVAP